MIRRVDDDWVWEGRVQDALVAHLLAQGWSIEQTSDTASRERRIDVLASRQNRRLTVEVKGFSSTGYARGEKELLVERPHVGT